MQKVEINEIGSDRIALISPYHPACPSAAKKLGGKWDAGAKAWTFDARDRERVREMARDLYGSDGTTPTEMVTLRVAFLGERDHYLPTKVEFGGRVLARCYGRDSGAPVGEGVVILEGAFQSGGSRKNPNLVVEAGTVIEIRDVPKVKAEQEVSAGYDWAACSILEQELPEEANRQALKEERARLVARIAEIDAALPS